MDREVAVFMSGGVDSSVSALLLKDKGYSVFGVTMVVGLPSDESVEKNSVVLSAKKICQHLGIPHFAVDLRKDFTEKVIVPFAKEYFKGRTPNPCVMCNPAIKFGFLREWAKKRGANKVATGHYVRILKNEEGCFEIHKGKDPRKDQSYMLYRLNQEQLRDVIFPLGDMKKEETRRIAKERGIPSFDKEESQEICFISKKYGDFLVNNFNIKPKRGRVVDVQGKVLGEHKGLMYYTVGQRKGLGISHPKPLYVVKIDYDRNELVVGYKEDVMGTTFYVGDVNWICSSCKSGETVLCKIRYNHTPSPARVFFVQNDVASKFGQISNNKACVLKVEFSKPQWAITPGQSAVFYSYPDGEKLLGGGVILTC